MCSDSFIVTQTKSPASKQGFEVQFCRACRAPGVALFAHRASRSWRARRGPESLLLLESSSNLVGDVHGAVDVLNVIELVELIDKTLNLLCIRN